MAQYSTRRFHCHPTQGAVECGGFSLVCLLPFQRRLLMPIIPRLLLSVPSRLFLFKRISMIWNCWNLVRVVYCLMPCYQVIGPKVEMALCVSQSHESNFSTPGNHLHFLSGIFLGCSRLVPLLHLRKCEDREVARAYKVVYASIWWM